MEVYDESMTYCWIRGSFQEAATRFKITGNLKQTMLRKARCAGLHDRRRHFEALFWRDGNEQLVLERERWS